MNEYLNTPASEDDLLPQDPPPWAARAASKFLIALFAGAFLAAIVIKVPETVRCGFVLTSPGGINPLRAPQNGAIKEFLVREGDRVQAGQTLFVLLSDAAGDRSSELRTLQAKEAELQAQITALDFQLSVQKRGYTTNASMQRREIERLRTLLDLDQKQLQFADDVRRRSEKLFSAGGLSVIEVNELRLQAEKASHQLHNSRKELEIARLALSRLRSEYLKERSRLASERRSLEGERQSSLIKIAGLQKMLTDSVGNEIHVRSPADAAVVRLAVKGAGGYVSAGEVMAELAADDAPVRAVLTVPAGGVGRIRNGQQVKLRFDAFPFQRFGAKPARIAWTSPAGVSDGQNLQFFAHAELAGDSVRVAGQEIKLLPGMTGHAMIITGRSRLISYGFEPLKELRENFAG